MSVMFGEGESWWKAPDNNLQAFWTLEFICSVGGGCESVKSTISGEDERRVASVSTSDMGTTKMDKCVLLG